MLENSLGNVALGAGDFPAATTHFLDAGRHLEEAFGKEDPTVADVQYHAGIALEEGGRFAEARQALERALAMRIKLLGPEHLSVGQSYKALGGLVDTMGGTEEALELFRRAEAIFEKTLPPDHQQLATALSSIATTTSVVTRPLRGAAAPTPQ